MSKKPINLDLSQLAEGGVQEKLDIELNRVFENIHDLNTVAKAKRKVQITLEIEPNETRDIVVMNSKIKTTLAPLMDVATTVLTGLNDEGQPEAQELKSGAKGQMFINEDGEICDDKGTSVEEIEELEKETRIINLQKQERQG